MLKPWSMACGPKAWSVVRHSPTRSILFILTCGTTTGEPRSTAPLLGGADFVQWHGNYPILRKTVELKEMAENLKKANEHGGKK